MRELYFIACGLILGVTLRDWLEAHEQRIAWRAADIAEETIAQRRKWQEQNPTPAAAGPTPA